MRVVTRPDFDGVVCAVLLMDALDIDPPVLWVQPSDMQRGRVDIRSGDVIANLPFHENCCLWFDHHYSNQPSSPVAGRFKIAPSAAGIIHDYYRERLDRDYSELVSQTDRIDAANLKLDEILRPQRYPYVLLSMTLGNPDPDQAPYWEHLVALLRSQPMERVMRDPAVRRRCRDVETENLIYESALKTHTTMVDHISITDFRGIHPAPNGNRFLVYSLFPECTVNVKIVDHDDHLASIKVGHSILKRGCNVNVGKMLAAFGGGGHPGAGACRLERRKTAENLARIVDILRKNDPI